MSDTQYRVTFQPQGTAVSVLAGTTILEAAAGAGLVIDTPCGGVGTCGKCKIRIARGETDPSEADHQFFSVEELRDGWRLACQTTVHCDIVVQVLATSLFGADHQIVNQSAVSGSREVLPSIRKLYVELASPSLEDDVSDMVRLEREIGPFETDLSLLRRLPKRLRGFGFKGTAVLADHRLLDFEDGDTTGRCYGVAFDLGTTTMVASLLDLCSGQQMAVASELNPQVVFGDDVLARIKHSSSCSHCLDELRSVVVEESSKMIRNLCEEVGVDSEHIYEVAYAGNTTMQHLLCGLDSSQLGEMPFAPAYSRGLLLSSREMEIPINPHGLVYVFPVIGGFVGGDTVAGILATELDSTDGPVLMIDIGTNGEIVLSYNGELWAASTAAGPAFEGARISCGTRASRGAIEKVALDEDVQIGVIGNVQPMGICGSGLVDLTAELLRRRIVSPEGRLLHNTDLPADVPQALADRVVTDDNEQTLFVVAQPEAALQRPVVLTQRDIREMQLGCGAIKAGIAIVLRNAGVRASDLAAVFIAGGFGSFIRRSNAQRIGLIPSEVDHQNIHYVGNVSLSGAQWALLSVEARERGEQLARRTHHVELSMSGDFQSEFAEAMMFADE